MATDLIFRAKVCVECLYWLSVVLSDWIVIYSTSNKSKNKKPHVNYWTQYKMREERACIDSSLRFGTFPLALSRYPSFLLSSQILYSHYYYLTLCSVVYRGRESSLLLISWTSSLMDLFCVNDHPDILIEILKRLDERSLGVAACVCRLWWAISNNDSLWENLCFSHVSPPPSHVRPVVLALGGYRRLYMVCLRPVLSRLSRHTTTSTWHEVQLSLSLFSVDCYERLLPSSASSSLMFLGHPVNVSWLFIHHYANEDCSQRFMSNKGLYVPCNHSMEKPRYVLLGWS